MPLRTIDSVTGHATAGITLGVYAHVTADSLNMVRRAIDTAWAGDDEEGAPRESEGAPSSEADRT